MTAPTTYDDVDDALLLGCVRPVIDRLRGAEWRIRRDGVWCYVGPLDGRRPVQGWKLHVSATMLSAPLVLARSAAVLASRGQPFKFAATLRGVAELNARRADRGSGGKVITVYPHGDDDDLRALAEELHRATEGMPGPGILTDRRYRAGSLVHYRFGAFAGVPVLGNDGMYEAMLITPDGSLARDRREPGHAAPAWAPADPFWPRPPGPAGGGGPAPVVLDGRYAVAEVIRHAFTGGVYRAVDQRTGERVVVKQARAHTGSDSTGRDVRDLRRHEARMLHRLAHTGLTPRPVAEFEQEGDLFLVQEELTGTTLRDWVAKADDELLAMAGRVVDLVTRIHAEGLVLRDLNPSNIMVTDGGSVRLIDLELLAEPGEPVANGYTPGYAPPEQIASPPFGPALPPAADAFALGATLFFVVAGTDPLLPPDEPEERPREERVARWLDLLSAGRPVVRRLTPIVAALMRTDPRHRPALDGIADRLTAAEPIRGEPAGPVPVTGRICNESAGPVPGAADVPAPLDRWIDDAVAYLVAAMDVGRRDRLWPVSGPEAVTDPFNVQYGAAGVLGVLARAHRFRPDPALGAAVAAAADWIGRWVTREPRTPPGLHFGRSGTAWALLDAGTAVDAEPVVALAADLALRVPVRWPNPDVCHGTAGAGLTQLHFWAVTGDATFLERARRAADALVAAAERREGLVRWPVPRDFPSALAGLVHYGFAHGVAGIGAFLLAAGQATGHDGYLRLAEEAGRTLVAVARVDRGAATWSTGDASDASLTHWCSGSSGVGTFLARLARHTGDSALRDLAGQAATAVHRSRWLVGPSQCHGLAGDADYLLDLADLHGDRRYTRWAADLVAAVYAREALRDGRIVPPDETGVAVQPAFGTGVAGVLASLLRLRHGGARLWLPDASAPIATGLVAGAGNRPDTYEGR